jgi:aminoglycoside phosphotransferase (APT) family kinase protein
VQRADGRYSERLELSQCAGAAIAYEDTPGDRREELTKEEAIEWGQSVRALHDAELNNLETVLCPVEPMIGTQARLETAAQKIPLGETTKLRRLVERQLPLLVSSGERVISHGDVRLSNAKFRAGRVMLIDTEAIGFAPRSYDLGCAWRSCALDNELSGDSVNWAWFREGYEAKGRMTPAVWVAAGAMACLRALWTMTLPVEIAMGWGDDWVSDPGYWSAHLAQIEWFANHTP